MRLVLLGGPGAGKGTQSRSLGKSLGLPVISMGDILRQAIAGETPMGLKAEPYVSAGKLLPDDVIIQFARQRLTLGDLETGWILEGYPRTAFQAEELDFLLEELGQPLDWALYLEITEETMKERSLNRALFDDTPEAITQRIYAFRQRTAPILEYYQGTQRLLTIGAEGEANQVERAILERVG
jgi:adenylate kinase